MAGDSHFMWGRGVNTLASRQIEPWGGKLVPPLYGQKVTPLHRRNKGFGSKDK